MYEEGRRFSTSGIKTKRKSVHDQQFLQAPTNNRQLASKLNRRGASLSEIKLDSSDSGQPRKKSSIYFPINKEDFIDEACIDYRESFRITLQEIYAEQDKEKEVKRHKQQKHQTKLRENNQNTFFSLFKYMANEHDSLLQIIVLTPLILTSIYIIFIEKGSLIK